MSFTRFPFLLISLAAAMGCASSMSDDDLVYEDAGKTDEAPGRPFGTWEQSLGAEACGVTSLTLRAERTYNITETPCGCDVASCQVRREGRYRYAGRRIGNTLHRYFTLYAHDGGKWRTYEYQYEGTDGLALARVQGAAPREWFTLTHVSETAMSQAEVDDTVRAAIAEAGVARMSFMVDAAEVNRQLALGGQVDFATAVHAALGSFILDGEHPESPLALIVNAEESEVDWAETECPGEMDTVARTRCFVGLPSSHFGMLEIGEAGEGEDPVDEAAWGFSLGIPDLSDHGHWAMVPRDDASATYNWGFN